MQSFTYRGLASCGSPGSGLLSANGDGELGLSRSALKSTFSKSGRFFPLLPDRARLAQDLSKLPYEAPLRSRVLLSCPEERKKSNRLPSSSSESTLLRRRRKVPFGVMSAILSFEVF